MQTLAVLLVLAFASRPAVAAPAPLDQAALQAAWDATADLAVAVDAAPRDAAGLQLALGPATQTWSSGAIFPVAPAAAADPWADALGLVVLGGGSLTTTFADRGEAQAFANHLAMELDTPRDQARGVRDDLRWTTPLVAGVVLTADPALVDLARAQAALAVDERQGKEAARLFDKRMEQHEGGQDVTRLVRLDRVLTTALGQDAAGSRVFAEVETDRSLSLDPDARHAGARATRDSWITQVVDDSGLWSERNSSELANTGQTEAGRPTWRTFATRPFPRAGGPDDKTSPPLPPVRWQPEMADTTVLAQLAKGRNVVETQTTSTLILAPTGGAMSWLVVQAPFVEERKDSWQLGGITLSLEDGSPLPALVLPAEPTSQWDERRAGSSNLVILGRPVDAGEEITVQVAWTDTLPWSNLSTDPAGTSARSLGHGTGLQSTIPSVAPGLVGDPWRFTTRVGLQADQDELQVALSGRTTRTWEADGRRWTEASHTATPAMWAEMAMGDWASLESPAPTDDLPDLKVRLFKDEAQALPGVTTQAWHAISYYQGLLPPFPYPELEIFQAPDMWFGFVWIAPHAMVASTQAKTITGMGKYFTENAPHLAEGVLAHEIAHQYWGHVARPGSTFDFWMAETFSELFSCLYVGATFGPDDYRARMDDYKKTWEEDAHQHRASLTSAYESAWQPTIVYNYGPYVMGEMLRPRLGDQAFFQGLFTLLSAKSEQVVSTEEIQLVMEAASGKELGDFFEYWVEGGYIPALTATWTVTGKGKERRVEGTVESDVPFGTFDVPVVVTVGRERIETWVRVVDGVGRFQTDPLPASKDKPTVQLDPDGRVLASARKVKAG